VASFTAPWSTRAFLYEINRNTASTMLVIRSRPPQGSPWSTALAQFGLRRKEEVIGYGGFWLLIEDVHISTIAVHAAWRNRGLGELLLLSLLEQGRDLGAQRATLEVRVSNLAAQSLYLKYGFEITTRRKRYYSDNNEDAYLMATPGFITPEWEANLRQRKRRLLVRLQAPQRPST
jgi:ribosomal-protein-alanine N-acetyltransferase